MSKEESTTEVYEDSNCTDTSQVAVASSKPSTTYQQETSLQPTTSVVTRTPLPDNQSPPPQAEQAPGFEFNGPSYFVVSILFILLSYLLLFRPSYSKSIDRHNDTLDQADLLLENGSVPYTCVIASIEAAEMTDMDDQMKYIQEWKLDDFMFKTCKPSPLFVLGTTYQTKMPFALAQEMSKLESVVGIIVEAEMQIPKVFETEKLLLDDGYFYLTSHRPALSPWVSNAIKTPEMRWISCLMKLFISPEFCDKS